VRIGQRARHFLTRGKGGHGSHASLHVIVMALAVGVPLVSATHMAMPRAQPGAEDQKRSPIIAGLEAALDLVALFFLPLLALVPHGVAPLSAVAGLCAIGLVLTTPPDRLRHLKGPTVTLGALVFWCALSAIWSIDQTRSLALAARIGDLAVSGLALVAAADIVAAPLRLTVFLLAGVAISILIAMIDCQTSGSLSQFVSIRAFRPVRFNQLALALAILVLPIGAMLMCRGRVALALLAVAAMALTVWALEGTAAKTVLVASAPAAALIYYRRRAMARAAALLSVIAIVAAPLVLPRLAHVPALFHAVDSFKESAGHRLLIWSFVGNRIAEHPIVGWGFDSSRAIPGGDVAIRSGETWLPLHPHDAALQVWLELGIPGVALFAMLIGLFGTGWPMRPGPASTPPR
jgi:exopolysaccharide production protein ExoQ